MIRGSGELINYLRDEVPRRVNDALSNGNPSGTLLKLSDLCVEVLARACPALSGDCVNDPILSAWHSLIKFVEFTREFVVIRYFAIALGSRELVKMGGDSLVFDMLSRDLVTCIEKFRVMTLKMLEVGKPWIEIISSSG